MFACFLLLFCRADVHIFKDTSFINVQGLVLISELAELQVSKCIFQNTFKTQSQGGAFHFNGKSAFFDKVCCFQCTCPYVSSFSVYHTSLVELNHTSISQCPKDTLSNTMSLNVRGPTSYITLFNSSYNHVATYGSSFYIEARTSGVMTYCTSYDCTALLGAVLDFQGGAQIREYTYSNVVSNQYGDKYALVWTDTGVKKLVIGQTIFYGNEGSLYCKVGLPDQANVPTFSMCKFDVDRQIANGIDANSEFSLGFIRSHKIPRLDISVCNNDFVDPTGLFSRSNSPVDVSSIAFCCLFILSFQ